MYISIYTMGGLWATAYPGTTLEVWC